MPLNHPRFLEWVGTPDTAWLLEMSPGHWCDTLSRDRALTAAMQLHKDACLMKSNLDILDQYALALHGTASTILLVLLLEITPKPLQGLSSNSIIF